MPSSSSCRCTGGQNGAPTRGKPREARKEARRRNSRSDNRLHCLLDPLAHDLPTLVQQPPAEREVLALEVLPLALLLLAPLFRRRREALGLVKRALEVVVCLLVGAERGGDGGVRGRESGRRSGRGRAGRKGGKERVDVAGAAEQRELNVRLQRQEDKDVERGDEASEGCRQVRRQRCTSKSRGGDAQSSLISFQSSALLFSGSCGAIGVLTAGSALAPSAPPFASPFAAPLASTFA